MISSTWGVWWAVVTAVCAIWVVSLWLARERRFRERLRAQEKSPKLFKISLAPRLCDVCEKPLQDGDIVAQWPTPLDRKLAHFECAPKHVSDMFKRLP